VAVVESLFEGRRELIGAISERLGAVEGSQFLFDARIRNGAWVDEQLYGLETGLQQAIKRKIRDLINAGLEPFTAVLRRLSSRVPATLMLDRAATMRFSSAVVWNEFRMLATAAEPIPRVPSIVMPEFSPEMMSEFPIDSPSASILAIIKKRSACDSLAVTFHLYDFVAAVLGLERREPEPIQLFKRYCRFRLPMYVDYLMEDGGSQEAIQNLMEEIGRNQ
jgi:hypothetical protein